MTLPLCCCCCCTPTDTLNKYAEKIQELELQKQKLNDSIEVEENTIIDMVELDGYRRGASISYRNDYSSL